MTDGGPLELAEVRVYGSESTAIDINTRNPPNLALLSLSFVHTHPPPLMIPSILHSTYFLCNIQRFFWFIWGFWGSLFPEYPITCDPEITDILVENIILEKEFSQITSNFIRKHYTEGKQTSLLSDQNILKGGSRERDCVRPWLTRIYAKNEIQTAFLEA